MANLWYVGIILEVISTMCGTVGKLLIRASALSKETNRAFSKFALHIGLVINTVAGPILDIFAYSFAPQSLIAPFGGLDLVWNLALAPYLLGERLTFSRGLGCLFVVVGTAVAAVYGSHTDAEYTIEFLEDMLLSLRVLIYGLVFTVWLALNRFWLMKYPTGSLVRGVSLGCTGGSLAGNLFCGKAAIMLTLRSIFEGEGEIWLHWMIYVMWFGCGFFAISNIAFMTQGLQEHEALFMVTVYEAAMIVSGCLSGAVVMLDVRGLEPDRLALYCVGIFIIILGMVTVLFGEVYIMLKADKQKSAGNEVDAEAPCASAELDRSSGEASLQAIASGRSGAEAGSQTLPAPERHEVLESVSLRSNASNPPGPREDDKE